MPTQTIAQWLQGLPNGQGLNIPWYSGRENGAAWVRGWGGECDAQVTLLKEATQARMPDLAPLDALPHLAGDRALILSQFETEENERTRIKTAWTDWTNAGQPAELLAQLYWGGFGNAVLVQQNGLAYELSGAPTAGEDPTALLTVTELALLEAPQTLFPFPQREGVNVSGTTGSLSPSGAAATRVITSKTIPAGYPWWRIDDRTDLCNRFEILFPGGSAAFMTYGIATFDGTTDTVEIEWNNSLRFQDTDYLTLVGAPTVTSGGAPMFVNEDVSGRTATGTTIVASAPFIGYVFVIAFPDGENPFANISDGDLNALRTLVKRWKPACTRCVGFHVLAQGRFWDWPVAAWDDPGLTWGPSDSVDYEAT